MFLFLQIMGYLEKYRIFAAHLGVLCILQGCERKRI